MNRQSAIALAVAVLIGLVAVYLANVYFNGVQQNQEGKLTQARLTKIAVASQEIPLGTSLTNTNVQLVDWPAASVPPGAFGDLRQATFRRIALERIMPGEPIMVSRISGTDGRATLSGRLSADRYAVSVPINEVSGVAGFVRPGDVVDVLLTRQIPGDGSKQYDKMTDVVVRGVPVLGVDQVLDRSKTDPAVGKTATLEVDMLDAQRLALARELGTISLALRNTVKAESAVTGTITQRDLGSRPLYIAARRDGPVGPPPPMAVAAVPPIQPVQLLPRLPVYTGPSMVIVRKGIATTYEVNHAY